MRRPLLIVLLAALGVGAVLAVGGVRLFLDHPDTPLRRADAVVVLAGDDARLPVAEQLVRRGIAPVLVVSEDPSGKDPGRDALCRTGRVEGAELVCRLAVPWSTRGEARMVAQLARANGWRSIVLVTSRYHLFRAHRIFRRCTDVAIVDHGVPASVPTRIVAVPLEWAKLVLAETLRRGC